MNKENNKIDLVPTRKDMIQIAVRRCFLFATDILLVNLAVLVSLWLRFNFEPIEQEYIIKYEKFAIPYTIICLVVFWIFRIYHSLWKYASITELYKIAEAGVIIELIHVATTMFLDLTLPRSCYVLTGLFIIIFMSISRFMYRMIRGVIQGYRTKKDARKIMIIGAGEAASQIIREINNSRYLAGSRVVCVIDDDPGKQGKLIHGIKIVGNRENIKEMARYYSIDEIIFAIPSASTADKKGILNICNETTCELKIIPGMYQMVEGEINLNDIRKVDVLDLLGREPVEIDNESVSKYIAGKVVMVTGGGGSIGSELCRQLAQNNPARIIIFDIYENNAYEIQQELKREYPKIPVETLIGSVRNEERLEWVFDKYRPDIVYHAAAHKHVPLMEESPHEAVKNNVFGTLNTVRMADKYKTGKFVMISTDKAVNPTNIMGATKRMCEMIIQAYNEKSKTDYVAVRFGNVLGSNGSVIPLFKKQMEAGGPVTVTHPEIIRYFMTIPEAVSLVLQAGAYAKGGEIFVLDMGEPVKIADLAKNLIRLSGYTLGVDMEIKFTGLRPGEKLYEELLMEEEGLQDTDNKLIHIGRPIDFNHEKFLAALAQLKVAAYDENSDMKEIVRAYVPTYHPEAGK